MHPKKIFAFILGLFLMTTIPSQASFKKEFARFSAWPISIAGYTLFGVGLLDLILLPIVLATDPQTIPLKFRKDLKPTRLLIVGLVASVIGATGIAGGKSLSNYAKNDPDHNTKT